MKYRVVFLCMATSYIDVEAENDDEAREKVLDEYGESHKIMRITDSFVVPPEQEDDDTGIYH